MHPHVQLTPNTHKSTQHLWNKYVFNTIIWELRSS